MVNFLVTWQTFSQNWKNEWWMDEMKEWMIDDEMKEWMMDEMTELKPINNEENFLKECQWLLFF